MNPLLHPSRHGTVVVVAAQPELGAQLAELHPEEQAIAAGLPPIRQREWVAGRCALREALRREALLDASPILRDDRGAPRVPVEAIGSISHKGDWAAALVTRRRPGCSLGLDLEHTRGPRVDISRRVLTAAELDELGRLEAQLGPAGRAAQLALRFSIKEAIYKAIDPWVRRYVGFREVELALSPSDEDSGVGRARAVDPKLVDALGDCALEVSWSRLGEHWICTAWAERG